MFHKGANAAAYKSRSAAVLLIKPSAFHTTELFPFGCFTALQLFRSVVKWGQRHGDGWSCLGTRQKCAESPEQVGKLSRH